MTEIYIRRKRKKGKYSRVNHRKYHVSRRNKRKNKILKNSSWKLQYPELFEIIEVFPYIIKKEQK